MSCQHPFVQRHLGTFKNGADSDGELLTAIPTLEQAGAMLGTFEALALLGAPAVRADNPISPTLRFHVGASGVVVVENEVVEVRDRISLKPIWDSRVALPSI